ncbi:translational elongation factor EF-1 alpha [Nowakowskiella sp. JEL0078]|nr:translational elongation factor EF-1 alpha [Nowakowskiella sp. JEL0078]
MPTPTKGKQSASSLAAAAVAKKKLQQQPTAQTSFITSSKPAFITSVNPKESIPKPTPALIVESPSNPINPDTAPAIISISEADVTPAAALEHTLSTSPLFSATSAVSERREAAGALAGLILSKPFETLGSADYNLHSILKSKVFSDDNSKGAAAAREGALLVYAILATNGKMGVEPIVQPLFSRFVALAADKSADVKAAAWVAALSVLMFSATRSGIREGYLEGLIKVVETSTKWQVRCVALRLVAKIATDVSPDDVQGMLTQIVPIVTGAMWDTKTDVVLESTKTMGSVCAVVGNPDIEPFLTDLIKSISNPEEVPICIGKLSGIRFVTTVRAGTLAILTPLLQRGLSERAHIILRATCVIIDNMCKLVEDPKDATHFLPILLPGVVRIIETAGPPELRAIAEGARSTLIRVGGSGSEQVEKNEEKHPIDTRAEDVKISECFSHLQTSLQNHNITPVFSDTGAESLFFTLLKHISKLMVKLSDANDFTVSSWSLTIASPLASVGITSIETARAVSKDLHHIFFRADRRRRGLSEDEDDIGDATDEEDADGPELCNCDFSLAYGSRILLNQTNLTLKRGQRYGILGRNGAGKTTLMRAISKGQLDGFPPPEQLRTLFVEHDLQASEVETPVIEFLIPYVTETITDTDERKKEADRVLSLVDFTEELKIRPVGNLSGGWKMKLGLARAMLYNADILLLDEPTNHLDTANVNWLMDYLCTLKDVTSIIVSHDSGFLDTVCTYILHYDNKKIKTYRGNLSSFKQQNPSANLDTLYSLSASTFDIKFPVPATLSGVKSKTRPILKMTNVTFTYPGNQNPTFKNVTVSSALASRVAVIGPNGAGKSTMIKLLTGDLLPTTGVVWKHPSLRIAYVAQHAFHHLEQHLDKTPNEYIQWRYATGIDRELAAKSTRVISASEAEAMSRELTSTTSSEKRTIECLVGRRKKGKSLEYEVKFLGYDHKWNTWLPRERLIELGFEKMVVAFDDFEAARTGFANRPLTTTECASALSEMGLEEMFAVHTKIRSLSAGQKVKVVLAAGMWNNPHMLVFDEPTNYLDRDALAALATAMEAFEGAVILISHNAEFVSKVCPETWRVQDGKVVVVGKTAVPSVPNLKGDEADDEDNAIEESGFQSPLSLDDNASNLTGSDFGDSSIDDDAKLAAKAAARLASKKKRSRKEEKTREVLRRQAWLAGKKLSDDSDEEWSPFKDKKKEVKAGTPTVVQFKSK